MAGTSLVTSYTVMLERMQVQHTGGDKNKKSEHLYSALYRIQTTLKHSGMDHTVLPAVNTIPAIYLVSVHHRDRPKTGFTFSAVNENGAENDFLFWARNRNETENQPLFSAENENEKRNINYLK